MQEFSTGIFLAFVLAFCATQYDSFFRLGFNKAGYAKAREITSKFLSSPSASPPSSALHRVHAVGNCHIDTAWLWPYEETERKAGRSFASAVHLMTTFPNYKFVASQVH